jgi:translocator protein
MKKIQPLKLITTIGISQLAGIIGSVFSVSAIPNWYATLEKPALNPPSWVFGPVWVTLYTLMGVAAYLIWTASPEGLMERRIRTALTLFGVQLILNALWSIVFFGFENPGGAFAIIVLMFLAIAATIILFHRIRKVAGWLLVPYILWVSFATYLNYAIWVLN